MNNEKMWDVTIIESIRKSTVMSIPASVVFDEEEIQEFLEDELGIDISEMIDTEIEKADIDVENIEESEVMVSAQYIERVTRTIKVPVRLLVREPGDDINLITNNLSEFTGTDVESATWVPLDYDDEYAYLEEDEDDID